MTKTSHRLDGLEPDNLLAFLALLGLLRALDLTRPDWRSRAYWDLKEAPFRPVLTTSKRTMREEICEAAADGLKLYRTSLRPFIWRESKGKDNIKKAFVQSRSHYKSLATRCTLGLGASSVHSRERLIWKMRCDFLASLGVGVTAASEAKKAARRLVVTPLKLPSGQMTFIRAQYDLLGASSSSDILHSLFEPWSYAYEGSSLRLSPDEARRYAYRASDPSPEGSRTELGASALGTLGLLAFTMSEGAPDWRVVAYEGTRSEGKVAYPIWADDSASGTTLHGVEAMLKSIVFKSESGDITCIGASVVATSRRYVLDPSQGDYGNIARARFIKL